MIDRNKSINKNIEKILSPAFEKRFTGKIEQDNGKIESFADFGYDGFGELDFNSKNQGIVRFYVDVTYKFKKNIMNYLSPERNKWNINDVYFIGPESVNADMAYIMNSAAQSVNKLSRKERAKYLGRK